MVVRGRLLCISCTAEEFHCVVKFVPSGSQAGCILSRIHCLLFPEGPTSTPGTLEGPCHGIAPFGALEAIPGR